MPPNILNSGINKTQFFSGRPYVYAGSSWFNTEFKPFDFKVYAGSSSFLFQFPSFTFEAESVSDKFTIVFPVFNAELSSVSGTISDINVVFPSFASNFSSETIELEAAVIRVTASGVVYQIPSINVSVNAVDISADGTVAGSITIVDPDIEFGSGGDDKYIFTGDTYIVLNLKTAAHSEYRDGNNNAIAQTGELTFSSAKLKNVSDAYVMSRSDKDVRLVVKSGENTERTYDITFNVDDLGNLKNKKVALAKGIKAANWQFSIGSPDGAALEVRGIDLKVSKLKRRV